MKAENELEEKTEITGSYWEMDGCSRECIVLDIWCFQGIPSVAVDISFPPSSSQFCVFMWDDATVWQDHILSPRLTAVWLWLFGNMVLLPRWSQEESGMLIFQCVFFQTGHFLWQSISVNAVRTNCIIQRERNKITAGRYLSSRPRIVSTPILSGWLFPKLLECRETSVTG